MILLTMQHATTKTNTYNIKSNGFRAGGYVTDSNLIELKPEERVMVGCLDDINKGACVCLIKVNPANLDHPNNGDFTCSGMPQYITRNHTPSSMVSCYCEKNGTSFGRIILIGVSTVVITWLIYKVIKNKN